MFTSFMMVANTDITIKIEFGWGIKLLISGMLIASFAIVASFITESVLNKGKIITRSLLSVSFILMLFAAIYGITKQVSITQSGATIQAPLYPLVNSLVLNYSADTIETFTRGQYWLIISFAISLLPFIVYPFTILSLTFERKCMRICGIIYSATHFTLALICGIIGAKSLNTIATEGNDFTSFASLGNGTILTMVLSLVSIGLLVATLCVKEKQTE